MRLLAVLLLLQHVAARNINIDVGAHWPRYSTSFVLELSEFLSVQSPKSFWSYVDDMCLLSFELDEAVTITAENSDLSTDVKLQKLNALAYAAASKIVQPLMHPLMRTMVSSRSSRHLLFISDEVKRVFIVFYLVVSCHKISANDVTCDGKCISLLHACHSIDHFILSAIHSSVVRYTSSI